MQAVFFEYGRCPLRLNTYVGDPIAMIRGRPSERRYRLAVLVLTWRVLGLSLAFRKGVVGPIVGWIGLTVEVRQTSIDVSISAARILEPHLLPKLFPRMLSASNG